MQRTLRVYISAALRVVTINAAYQLRMDDQIGSIEVGKFADFAVLSDNSLSRFPRDLMTLPILGTYLAGQASATLTP